MPGKQPAGSPTAGEPTFLAVGKIRRPHGVAGEVLVELTTDFPERLRPEVVVFAGEKRRPLTILTCRTHHDGLLIAFEGISTPEQAGHFCNQILYIPTADRHILPEGAYYHYQLLGMRVIDEGGQELGELTEILQTGANDVYVVTRVDGGEILLPAIASVVQDIDLPSKGMRVHLLPGLFSDKD